MGHSNSSYEELAASLDEFVHVAADAPDTKWSTTVLARAVRELEAAAEASLGDSGPQALVVLQRRLGRVHGRLLSRSIPLTPATVQAYIGALSGQPLPPQPQPGSPGWRSEHVTTASPNALASCAS